MNGNWRSLRSGDLAAVSHIAACVHPTFPEDDAVLAERLSLAPQGCFLLELAHEPCGYLLSHPWHAYNVPPLNSSLGSLPENPKTWYLHDLALLPQAQGQGHAGPIVEHLIKIAETAQFSNIALVAVNGSHLFWARFGFREIHAPALRKKLSSYDEAALYMMRAL